MKKTLLPLLLLISPLHATTILVDFGPTATTSTSPSWNSFTGSTAGASLSLVDTGGVSTTYTITLSGAVSQDNANSVTPAHTFSPFTPADVLRDFVFSTSARSFTLSGLDPSVTYDFTFFSYADRTGTRLTQFTVGGGTPQTVEPSLRETIGTGGGTVSFTGVTPNPSGNIVIAVSSAASTNWILSGLEINYTVPEPSAALLSGLGLLPLLRRRR